MMNKKGQVVIFGLARTAVLVVLGIFLMDIYPTARDLAFAATDNIVVRLFIYGIPIFYLIGIIYSFVAAIRSR